jgi:copper chaperone CopZ
MDIQVDNIKCGGCTSSIKNKINTIIGVESCEVDVEKGIVSITGKTANLLVVKSALKDLGYPETGTTSGVDNLKSKAKSFVSCAVGSIKGD